MVPSRRFYAVLLHSVALLNDVDDIVSVTRMILLEMFSMGKEVNNNIRRSLSRILMRLCKHATPRQKEIFVARLKVIHVGEAEGEASKQGWDLFLDMLHKEGLMDQLSIQVWQKMSQREKTEVGNVASIVSDIPFQDNVEVEESLRESLAPQHISLLEFTALDLKTKSSPAAYAMRLRVYAVIRRDSQAAQIIYRSMLQHKVRPTMHHISPIIEGLVLSDRIPDAEKVKEAALKEITTAEISSRMYGALCRGYSERQNWLAVCEIAEEMHEKGISILQSFASGFQKARRMLQTQATFKQAQEGGEGGRKELEGSLQLTKILNERKSWTVNSNTTTESATWLFQEYVRNNKHILAHQHVAKALRRGVEADYLLRDLLRSSTNYLKKEVDNLQDQPDLSPRRLLSRKRALEMGMENRRNAAATKESMLRASKAFQAERRLREDFLVLLRDAVASNRLWEEAHSDEYKRELASVRRRRFKQRRARENKRSSNESASVVVDGGQQVTAAQ
ncbi:hypothetical protein CBS101457_003777 [Exobasidium rhododendri]|nr:hypothetical protein CBS101457_003777 [Exobasidium rhododendri]